MKISLSTKFCKNMSFLKIYGISVMNFCLNALILKLLTCNLPVLC